MQKLLNILFYLVPLLTALVSILWILSGLTVFQSSIEPFTIIFFGILPLALLASALFFLSKSFRNIQLHGKPFSLKKKISASLFISSFVIQIGVIAIAGLLLYSLLTEKPPQFFPFDDPDATYTIVRENGKYWIHYQTTSGRNSSYVCSYPEGGGQQQCQTEFNKDVKILVGESPIELQPFVNRNVKVNGRFIYTTEQCIAATCQEVGNWAALELFSIDIVK